MMASILSLNVKGFVSHQKQLSFFQLASNTNSPVCFLQETNFNQDSTIIYPQKFFYFINPPVQPASGVVIALKKEFYEEIEVISHKILTHGYLQAVHIKHKRNEQFHLINVYMTHDHALSEEVANKICTHITNIKDAKEKIIIAGDWNATLEDRDRRNCKE